MSQDDPKPGEFLKDVPSGLFNAMSDEYRRAPSGDRTPATTVTPTLEPSSLYESGERIWVLGSRLMRLAESRFSDGQRLMHEAAVNKETQRKLQPYFERSQKFEDGGIHQMPERIEDYIRRVFPDEAFRPKPDLATSGDEHTLGGIFTALVADTPFEALSLPANLTMERTSWVFESPTRLYDVGETMRVLGRRVMKLAMDQFSGEDSRAHFREQARRKDAELALLDERHAARSPSSSNEE